MTLVLLAIGLFVLWKILKWLLRPLRIRLAEMRMRRREREIADADTMAHYKVDDDKLYTGPAQNDVAQKIREALLQKKRDDQEQRHHHRIGSKKV